MYPIYMQVKMGDKKGSAVGQQRRPATSTATRLCFTLPLPTSINEQYYTDKQGRRRLTPGALRYKAEVRRIVRDLMARDILHETLLAHLRKGYLAVFIECFFETPLRRDLDGGIKITVDALCHELDINDNRLVDLHLSKRIRPLDPHLYVEIDALDHWDFDEEYRLLPTP